MGKKEKSHPDLYSYYPTSVELPADEQASCYGGAG